MEISFFVPGPPVAKERPRKGRDGHMFTPPATRNYEKAVGYTALGAMRGEPPMKGPVDMSIIFIMKMPKRGKMFGDPHICTPDADNLWKAISDGCNGIIYGDDSQVCKITVSKQYGQTPGAHVIVRTF